MPLSCEVRHDHDLTFKFSIHVAAVWNWKLALHWPAARGALHVFNSTTHQLKTWADVHQWSTSSSFMANSYFGAQAVAARQVVHFVLTLQLLVIILACAKFDMALCCGQLREFSNAGHITKEQTTAARSLDRKYHHNNPGLLITTSVHLEAERSDESAAAQKLLQLPISAAAASYPAKYNIHRKLRASMPLCSIADLSITQGLSGYSNGIPVYTVQIVNLCLNPKCQMSNIHVACEAFSSARPLDTLVFHRLGYNDCYLMNGEPLSAGASVAFEYANSSEYPMHIISAEVGSCTPAPWWRWSIKLQLPGN